MVLEQRVVCVVELMNEDSPVQQVLATAKRNKHFETGRSDSANAARGEASAK